jgi:hypothetical protein
MLLKWRELKARLLAMFDRYGPVALVVWLGMFGATMASFYAAIRFGVDLAAIATRLGLDPTRVAEATGTVAVAYGATYLTKPLRIVIALAVTPPVAHWWEKRRGLKS